MKTWFTFFVLCLVLIFSDASAQWVQTTPLTYKGYATDFVVSGGNIFAAIDSGGVFLSSDYGSTWIAVNNGLPTTHINCLALSPTSGGSGAVLFAGTTGAGVFKSTNNGANWVSVNNNLPTAAISYIALLVSGPYLYASTFGTGVYRSSDNGASWAPYTTDFIASSATASFVVSGSSLYGTSDAGGVFVSTNNGTSWSSAGMTGRVIYGLCVNGTELYAMPSGGGFFYSANNGATWAAAAASGLPNLIVYNLRSIGNTIVAGTWGDGVYISTNKGASWTPANDGFGSDKAYIMFVGVRDPYIYAGAQQGRIWRRPLWQVATDVMSFVDVPTSYILQQNYPNPFNPATSFEFQVPSFEFVSLRIYDLLGREVTTLVNEPKAPGVYKLKWDAGTLASGIYMYRLTAGSFTDTKKLVLLR